MNFKFWLNETEDYRPNASGFESMQKSLEPLGFVTSNDLGFYYKYTDYDGEIFVMGDRKGQYKNSNLRPGSGSEYWRIFLKIPPERLDDRSRQAISKFAGNKPDGIDPISNGEKLKIRSNFTPRREFGNGPEIDFQKGTIVFSWYVREPKFVYKILEHLLDKPPQYIGGLDDNNDDGEQDYSPFKPQPGNLLTV